MSLFTRVTLTCLAATAAVGLASAPSSWATTTATAHPLAWSIGQARPGAPRPADITPVTIGGFTVPYSAIKGGPADPYTAHTALSQMTVAQANQAQARTMSPAMMTAGAVFESTRKDFTQNAWDICNGPSMPTVQSSGYYYTVDVITHPQWARETVAHSSDLCWTTYGWNARGQWWMGQEYPGQNRGMMGWTIGRTVNGSAYWFKVNDYQDGYSSAHGYQFDLLAGGNVASPVYDANHTPRV